MIEEPVSTAESEEEDEGPPSPAGPAVRFSMGQMLLLVVLVAVCFAAGPRFVAAGSVVLGIMALSQARTAAVVRECRRRGITLTPRERGALAAGSFVRAAIAVLAYSGVAAAVLLAVAADQNWELVLNETYVIGFAFAAIAGYQTWVVLKWLLWDYRFPPDPTPGDVSEDCAVEERAR